MKSARKIQIGDQIIFTNRDNPSQTATVKVIGLLRYATFHDLFSHNDPRKFGGKSVEWLENQMNGFYPLDKQLQNGVIGIEFILIWLAIAINYACIAIDKLVLLYRV